MAYYASLSAAITDGVRHYWPMDEPEGTAVADLAGGWNAAIYTNDRTLSSTEIAASIVPSQSDLGRDVGAYIGANPQFAMPVRAESPAPDTSTINGVSVRIRFYLTSNYFDDFSGTSGLFALFQFGDTEPVLAEVLESSTGFRYRTGGRTHNVGGNPFTVGAWNDLIITSDVNGSTAYLNGTEIFSSTDGWFSYNLYQNSSNAFLGAKAQSSTSDRYLGSSEADIIIQDVTVWERRLSATDATSLWTAGFTDRLVDRPAIEVSFDVTAGFEPEFTAYAQGYSGFSVTAPFSAAFEVYQDWTETLESLLLQEAYQLVITGAENDLDDLIVPISNWQATNQSNGRSAYLQAVIPNADQLIDDLSARPDGSLVIKKGFRLPSGQSQFSEILRSDFDSLRYDRSGNRFTVTVSGRRKNEAPASGQRTLKGIRTISVTDGSRRVRCDIDLFLRPGMTAVADGSEFKVETINYFISTNDKFCEVSE